MADFPVVETDRSLGTRTLPEGSAAAPALAFQIDKTTGIYQTGTGRFGIASVGIKIIEVMQAGIRLGAGVSHSTPGTNVLMVRDGDDPSGAITSCASIWSDGVTLKKIIADGTASDIQT